MRRRLAVFAVLVRIVWFQDLCIITSGFRRRMVMLVK